MSSRRWAFTKCPLTVDYTILRQIADRIDFCREEFKNHTAIGTGLATAVGRLKESKAKSKVIILVTDGENNFGIDPMTAASIAEAMDIRVYTIGIVPMGMFEQSDEHNVWRAFYPQDVQCRRISDEGNS